MFELSAQQVMSMRGGDGMEFTRFVDAVLRAELAAATVHQTHIQTNQKAQSDGGVDTCIDVAADASGSGWLISPTCWQYKASTHSSITIPMLSKEIKKHHCAALIKGGAAWRLAVADEISADKRLKWERAAEKVIRKINPNAPAPRIVTASDLAHWGSKYIAVGLRFFPPPHGAFLDHRAQAGSVRGQATPNYVSVPSWTSVGDLIKKHCDFGQRPGSPIFTVQGEAGVGKTRLVFETVAALLNATSLAVYTSNPSAAEEIAHHVARAHAVRCILVVDECTPAVRAELGRLLAATECVDRCRVIALDNSGEQATPASIEAIVPMMTRDELQGVLESNFPTVPKDRRRVYADAAEGFVRIAADLCSEDPLAASTSFRIPGGIEQYVRGRLGERRRALEAISTVWRCGFRDDRRDQFAALCAWLKLDEGSTRDDLRIIKERPGFLRDEARYAYVTPDLVARLAFGWAWERWAAHDVVGFLSTLPEQLIDPFLKRVQHSAREEVRRCVGEYFRAWLGGLSAEDLRDASTMKRATLLVESNVSECLPVLERTICAMTVDQLRAIEGDSHRGWGPRRHLVWLLEQLARLPECFRSVESMLRKLSVAESEPRIGNNASAIYHQLFRFYGSGVAVAYLERTRILREVLVSSNADEKRLAISALRAPMQGGGFKLVGRTFVAGRVPPDEWRPASSDEHVEASREVVALLIEATKDRDESVRSAALGVLAGELRRLLRGGFLREVRGVLRGEVVAREYGPELLAQIGAYLQWDTEKQAESYVSDVRSWSSELVPDDLPGRLIRYVGGRRLLLDAGDEDGEFEREIARLAQDLVTVPGALESNLPWLASDKAAASSYLGSQVGKLDQEGAFIGAIVRCAVQTAETGFARGYCHGLCSHGAIQASAVADALSAVEDQAPQVAYEISVAAEPISACIARVRRLVSRAKIPSACLAATRFSYSSETIGAGDAESLLGDLVAASKAGDEQVMRGAVELIAAWADDKGRPDWLATEAILSIVWEIAETATIIGGAGGYHWKEVLRFLVPQEPSRAVRLCIAALVADSTQLVDEAEQALQSLIPQHGPEVVAQLGSVMLDEQRGWLLNVRNLRSLFSSLPQEDLKKWLVDAGVKGARMLAHHLRAPAVGSDGSAVVDPLTEYVLREYENDDDTFYAFLAGTHSMQVYMGDIAAQHQAEADAARPLLNHPLRRVREWAAAEISAGEADAKMWRRREQERKTEF